MAMELLKHLHNKIGCGIVNDTEVNLDIARINLLSQGVDLEWA